MPIVASNTSWYYKVVRIYLMIANDNHWQSFTKLILTLRDGGTLNICLRIDNIIVTTTRNTQPYLKNIMFTLNLTYR